MALISRGHSIGLAVGLGALATVLTATAAGPALAQGIKPVLSLIVNDARNPVPVRSVASDLTHVGRPASEIVQLEFGARSLPCFVRLAQAGTFETGCYAPPAGRTLIITDVQWFALVGGSAGNYAGVQLILLGEAVVFEGAGTVKTGGYAGNSHHFQTGFVFHPDMIANLNHVKLYGYLAPSE